MAIAACMLREYTLSPQECAAIYLVGLQQLYIRSSGVRAPATTTRAVQMGTSVGAVLYILRPTAAYAPPSSCSASASGSTLASLARFWLSMTGAGAAGRLRL